MIVVDDRVLELNASGTVSAGIWVSFSTGDFPAEGWDDFASAILLGVGRAILEVGGDPPSSRRVPFYEDPLGIELQWTAAELRVLAIATGSKRAVVHEQEFGSSVFTRNVIEVSERLLGWCDERRWTSGEIEALREVRALLEQTISASARGL